MSATAPGWYSDPYDQRLMRWWNGQLWTAHAQVVPEQPSLPAVSVAPAVAAEPVPPVPGALPQVAAAQAAAPQVGAQVAAPQVLAAQVAAPQVVAAQVATAQVAAVVPVPPVVAAAAAPLPTRRSLRAYAALDAGTGDALTGAESLFSTTQPLMANATAAAPVTPVTPVTPGATSLPSGTSAPARWENSLAGDVPRRRPGRHSQLLSVALVIGIVGLGGCGVYFYPLMAAGF